MQRLVGPRVIGKSKRITLPMEFRGTWVTVLPEVAGRAQVAVRMTTQRSGSWTQQDRPRRVTSVGQVKIPAKTLRDVAWEARDEVYLLLEDGVLKLVAGNDLGDFLEALS